MFEFDCYGLFIHKSESNAFCCSHIYYYILSVLSVSLCPKLTKCEDATLYELLNNDEARKFRRQLELGKVSINVLF